MRQGAASLSHSILRPNVRSRPEKSAILFSAIAFFGAISVVGWFGLSGIETGEEELSGEPVIIFAGGAEPQPAVPAETSATAPAAEEEPYFVGNFGDPVDELYASDRLADEARGGGWGPAALDNAL